MSSTFSLRTAECYTPIDRAFREAAVGEPTSSQAATRYGSFPTASTGPTPPRP